MKQSLDELLTEIRVCTACKDLPLGPRPIVSASIKSRIVLAGQAPGTRVHKTGIPWNDPSGDRLREWLDMDRDIFYNEDYIAVVPMGFCYPGKGERGDLPPRPLCAELWQEKLKAQLPNVKLTLLIGSHALKYHLGKKRRKTLAETVKHWREYLGDGFIPLVHPSPRNIMWRRRNPWFETEVVPQVRQEVWKVIGEVEN